MSPGSLAEWQAAGKEENGGELTHVLASVAAYTLFVKRASSPVTKDECDRAE